MKKNSALKNPRPDNDDSVSQDKCNVKGIMGVDLLNYLDSYHGPPLPRLTLPTLMRLAA